MPVLLAELRNPVWRMQAAPHGNSYQVTVAPDERTATNSPYCIFANSKIHQFRDLKMDKGGKAI
jgi:hypothetical protein